MLGRTLRGEFREHEVVVAGLPEADITDAAGIDAVCRSCKPDVLIHCAAMTDVDKCETCPDMAWKINAVGSANVASACQRNGIRLIAISTDYVFSGDSERPYTEFDTPTGGINVYGQSKWAAGCSYALSESYYCPYFMALWSRWPKLCAHYAETS